MASNRRILSSDAGVFLGPSWADTVLSCSLCSKIKRQDSFYRLTRAVRWKTCSQDVFLTIFPPQKHTTALAIPSFPFSPYLSLCFLFLSSSFSFLSLLFLSFILLYSIPFFRSLRFPKVSSLHFPFLFLLLCLSA